MIEFKVNPRLQVELDNIVHKAKLESDKEIRWFAEHVFDLTVLLTPWDEGDLKASWNMSRGAPEPVQRSILGRILRSLRLVPDLSFRPIYITNGQPYALIVEYGLYTRAKEPYRRKFRGTWMTGIWSDASGFSVQAPGGMVRLAVRQTIIAHKRRRR